MVAETLRTIRTQLGLTRAELSVRSGVSYGAVQSIEQGRHDPKGNTLIRLADALGCSVDELLGRAPLRPTGTLDATGPYRSQAA